MSQAKCRVLFIDDHEDTSEMFSLLLGEEEYSIEHARTIAQALQLATSEEFDLYVLDKHMPDGSGIELCTKLNELTPGIPCLVYSGDAYEIHRAEAIAAGADAFVAKPDVESLIENIKKLLANRECSTSG